MGYTLKEPDILIKILNLLERKTGNIKVSYNHLAFAVLLSFNIEMKICTLGDKIRTTNFFPEELLELLERASIYV